MRMRVHYAAFAISRLRKTTFFASSSCREGGIALHEHTSLGSADVPSSLARLQEVAGPLLGSGSGGFLSSLFFRLIRTLQLSSPRNCHQRHHPHRRAILCQACALAGRPSLPVVEGDSSDTARPPLHCPRVCRLLGHVAPPGPGPCLQPRCLQGGRSLQRVCASLWWCNGGSAA